MERDSQNFSVGGKNGALTLRHLGWEGIDWKDFFSQRGRKAQEWCLWLQSHSKLFNKNTKARDTRWGLSPPSFELFETLNFLKAQLQKWFPHNGLHILTSSSSNRTGHQLLFSCQNLKHCFQYMLIQMLKGQRMWLLWLINQPWDERVVRWFGGGGMSNQNSPLQRNHTKLIFWPQPLYSYCST